MSSAPVTTLDSVALAPFMRPAGAAHAQMSSARCSMPRCPGAHRASGTARQSRSFASGGGGGSVGGSSGGGGGGDDGGEVGGASLASTRFPVSVGATLRVVVPSTFPASCPMYVSVKAGSPSRLVLPVPSVPAMGTSLLLTSARLSSPTIISYRPPRHIHAFRTLVSCVTWHPWHPMTRRAKSITARPYVTVGEEYEAIFVEAEWVTHMMEGPDVEGPGQGLTLVHFSAQLEPCLTHKNTLHPRTPPLTRATQPLRAAPIP